MRGFKYLSVLILFLSMVSCSEEEDEDNKLHIFEVEISFSGDINDFSGKQLFISASTNDGSGEFISGNLLLQPSGTVASKFYDNDEIVNQTYNFITENPEQVLIIDFKVDGSQENPDAVMTITVSVKIDGQLVDDFSINYDGLTYYEHFELHYIDGDEDDFRCYCAAECNEINGVCN